MSETSDDLHVREVAIEVTDDLRWRILRPDAEPGSFEWPDFGGPGAATYAVFAGDDPTPRSTVTILPEPCPWRPEASGAWRLRGMATDDGWQGRGVGRLALDATIAHVARAGADLLWCNARTRAVPFYARAGFEAHGEEFEIEGIGPHVAMARPITSGDGRQAALG